MTDLTGRKALVVGLGLSGDAAAHALLDAGAYVTVVDDADDATLRDRAQRLTQAGASVQLGGAHQGPLQAHDLAVVSPGIPMSAAILREVRSSGIEMWSEVELAARLARCPFVAITGTNGKTTVTSLLAGMLRAGGVPAVAAGNIGFPLTRAVREVPDDGVIAAEVSSFQLATIVTFRPAIAVVLNVAEDHIDWHGSADAYLDAKARIFENQEPEDVLILNADDPLVASLAPRARSRIVWFSARRPRSDGLSVVGDEITWNGTVVCARSDVTLPGAAGLENALAAAGAALEFGVSGEAVGRGLRTFVRGAHRMQTVTVADGIRYIDDSKATNPHATLAALEGLEDVVLIAGGRAKGVDLSVLAQAAGRLRAVVALGEARDEVARVFSGLVPVRFASSMREAVTSARDLAIAGGSVLLSPACASLDMYEGYAARGDDFARYVTAVTGREDGS